MISRYQTILFVILVAASVAMGVMLWQLRERAHQRLLAGQDTTPTKAPEVAPSEKATLLVANDTDNSLLGQVQILPLPQDPGARARLVLGKLLDLYSAPNALHPVPGGAPSIEQVFLLPAPGPGEKSGGSRTAGAGTAQSTKLSEGDSSGPELAVVNLDGKFVASHPSGIETESLTLLSLCGTLHANLPRVTEVRFLVDGQPRATLAGHADLTRTYLAGNAVSPDGARP